MSIALLDLPNELLGIVAFHLIDGVWNKDVRDFLSLTSACRRLHELSREEKYWHRMALRRDPTGEKPADVPTWFEYCRQSKTAFAERNVERFLNEISLSHAHDCTR